MENKDLTFVLFKNENRKTDRHPHYSGRATINGVEFFADAWENQKNGKTYFSGKLKPKNSGDHPRSGESGYQTRRPDSQPGDSNRIDEETPF